MEGLDSQWPSGATGEWRLSGHCVSVFSLCLWLSLMVGTHSSDSELLPHICGGLFKKITILIQEWGVLPMASSPISLVLMTRSACKLSLGVTSNPQALLGRAFPNGTHMDGVGMNQFLEGCWFEDTHPCCG